MAGATAVAKTFAVSVDSDSNHEQNIKKRQQSTSGDDDCRNSAGFGNGDRAVQVTIKRKATWQGQQQWQKHLPSALTATATMNKI